MILLYKKNNKSIVEPVIDHERYNELVLNPNQGGDSFTDIVLTILLSNSKDVAEYHDSIEETSEVEVELEDLPDEDD